LAAVALLLAAAVAETSNLAVSEIPLAQFLSVEVALYVVAATRPRRTGVTALSMALALLVAYMAVRVLSGWSVGTSAELAVALTAVIAWLLGDATHRTREYAERIGAQAAEQAVTAERLRIAREMHDMVAHSIGIIALQAGAAARVAKTQPDAAREAMTAVENAGRETLAGLRRMLVALREADAPEARAEPRRESGTRAPQPSLTEGQLRPRSPAEGLADIDRLAAATTAAGVRVTVRRRGETRQLPPDIDLSAFRIVQESITNVVRHSGTDTCHVTLDYRDDEELAIDVTDHGRGHGTSTDTGFGLAGMRERVALLHGEFTAAPHAEGGFRVTARIPVPMAVAR
jgi:signal transduction histidine kinase